MTIGSRLTKIERALRMASEPPPSDDEVRWANEVSDLCVALMAQQILAEDDARLALTDKQIAFMDGAEVARAQAICERHRSACGIGPIDFETGRRLPKHDLAEMEAERPAVEVAEADGPVPAGVTEV